MTASQKIKHMSRMQNIHKQQKREARLQIVGELYKKGYTRRKIQEEVKKRLDLSSYALGSVHNDIQLLLKEWREENVKNVDELVTLELQRIDECVKQLWAEWEKSKATTTERTIKLKGKPHGSESVKTTATEKTEKEVKGMGDVAYIVEIRRQLEERRKLLGLYAPEKRVVSGDVEVNNRYDVANIPHDLLFKLADALQDGEKTNVSIYAEEIEKIHTGGE